MTYYIKVIESKWDGMKLCKIWQTIVDFHDSCPVLCLSEKQISTLSVKKKSHGSDQSSFLEHYCLKCILYLSEVRVFFDISVHALFSFRDLLDKLKVTFLKIISNCSFDLRRVCEFWRRPSLQSLLEVLRSLFIVWWKASIYYTHIKSNGFKTN